MADLVASLGLLIGSAFIFLGALGAVRMPDVYRRLHAATKAGALGAGIMVAAAALALPGEGLGGRALATILFVVLTGPVAGHALGRAYYRRVDT